MKNRQTISIWHLPLVIFLLVGQLLVLCSPAQGALRAVAGGGSGGGSGTTGCTTSSGNGNIVYVSAGACTSNSNLSTDGAGAVSASASITAPVATHTTSVTSPLHLATGTMGFRGQGASTDGATVTNNLWTFNGVVLGASGSASAPSYGFSANPTTGFHNQGGAFDIDVLGTTVAIWGANNVQVPSTYSISYNADLMVSRSAAGVLQVGGSGGGVDSLGSIKGVTTNSNAPALSIGEYVTSSVASTGATVSLTTNTPVTAVSTGSIVTAGDWDVTGVVCYITATTTSITVLTQGVSTTSNVLGSLGTYTSDQTAAEVPTATTDSEICHDVPVTRVSLSGTSNVFLVTKAKFTVSTLSAYGFMRLRRVR